MAEQFQIELVQIELEPAKIQALDAIVQLTGKRREELLAQAIEDFLATEQQNLDAIHEGLGDLETGRVATHEEVLPRIKALRSAQ